MTSKVDFDRYVVSYESLLSSQTNFFVRDSGYFARYKVGWIKRLNPNATNILEFGCGIGRNIGPMREAFPRARITGCDLSIDSLAFAGKQHPGCSFVTNSALNETEMFDVVLASCVLHHVRPDERHAELRFCRDRLRPGGNFIVFEHNPFNPVTRYLVNTCPFDEDAVLLSRRETERQLRAAGFTSIQSSYCLFFPESFGVLRTLESYLGWLPLGGQYVTWASR